MQITIDAICKEFDIRPEEIFAFLDEENVDLGGSLMHDIEIELTDFRKFIEYRRRQLRDSIAKAEKDLEQLDEHAEAFLGRQRNIRFQDFE